MIIWWDNELIKPYVVAMLTHRAISWCKAMLMKARIDESKNWWNDELMKWWNDELMKWWIDELMKYWADETLIRGNDELT